MLARKRNGAQQLNVSFLFSSEAAVENDETRLYKDLFHNYEKYNRPVLNQSEAVKVVFDFQLIRVIDVVSHFFSIPGKGDTPRNSK